MHPLQHQELPKDRTAPTMHLPAANWGLCQGCPNPFRASQKDPFFQFPLISNPRCCHWRASREALSEGHTGLTQVSKPEKSFQIGYRNRRHVQCPSSPSAGAENKGPVSNYTGETCQ